MKESVKLRENLTQIIVLWTVIMNIIRISSFRTFI